MAIHEVSGGAMDSEAVLAVVDFLQRRLPELMTTGENWKLTLHGGRSGDIRHELQLFGQLVPPKSGKPVGKASQHE